ncbi:MAG: ATP-binding protein [Pyrinomonadaceae bacterium]
MTRSPILLRFGLALAAIVLSFVVLINIRDTVNPTTVAMIFLVIVLSSATFFGRNPALLTSFAAMLIFNYFFLPPFGTWHIADSQNLVAWAAFTVTAIIAGELSAYARRRAVEAERLYQELEMAFEKATEAEALKKSEKLKSALLDAVTHDLRTPLTSIKAAVTTLLDSEGGHRTIELSTLEKAEFLDIINEETDRLNGFVESMVQLARIEAGALGEGDATARVEEIITLALERAEPVIAGHHLLVNMEKSLPRVSGDARAIAEVIYNLVDNAAKYSPDGTTITITARREEQRIAVSVADEGDGIPLELRERVFEKFQRLDEKTEGLGLGLAISKGIVEAQNGSIGIASGANGKGATLTVRLPIGKI